MARPERNNVDYFPHPVKHGKKMFFIRKKYGNDGYTVWNMLLEKLGDANFHYLDLNDETELMYLYSEFDVTEETLFNIIDDLIKLGEFDKEFWEEERILFNQKFIDSINDAYSKRRNDCINRNLLIELLEDKGRIKPDKFTRKPDKEKPKVANNPQSIVEDSIEKKTKVKETIFKREDFFTDIVEIFYWKNWKEPFEVAETFWNHYEGTDWVNAKKVPIVNPLAAAKNWKNQTTEGKNCSESILKKWQIAYHLIKAKSPQHREWLLSLRVIYQQTNTHPVIFKGPQLVLDMIIKNKALGAIMTDAIKKAFGDDVKYKVETDEQTIAA